MVVYSKIRSYEKHPHRNVLLVSLYSLPYLLELEFEGVLLMRKLDVFIKSKTTLAFIYDVSNRNIITYEEKHGKNMVKGYYPI